MVQPEQFFKFFIDRQRHTTSRYDKNNFSGVHTLWNI
jgi:hypothetical protein